MIVIEQFGRRAPGRPGAAPRGEVGGGRAPHSLNLNTPRPAQQSSARAAHWVQTMQAIELVGAYREHDPPTCGFAWKLRAAFQRIARFPHRGRSPIMRRVVALVVLVACFVLAASNSVVEQSTCPSCSDKPLDSACSCPNGTCGRNTHAPRLLPTFVE